MQPKPGTNEVTREIGAFSLRAVIGPGAVNVEYRTAKVTFSTGARVTRSGFFTEPFAEELSLDPAHVRMERFKSGRAPVLNAHDSSSLGSVIGVVLKASVDGKEGTAAIRFAKAEDDPVADQIFRKVADGIIANVSIGYRVHKFERIEDPASSLPVLRATDWEPLELSIVPIGADVGAKLWSADATREMPCTFVTRSQEERAPMNPEKKTLPGSEPSLADIATRAERDRVTSIRQAVRVAKLDDTFADQLISDGVPLEAARGAVIDALAMKPENQYHIEPHHRMNGDESYASDFQGAAIDAILMRSGIRVEKPHAGAHDISASVADLARTCLSRAGKTGSLGGGNRLMLVQRAMTTSDFPAILAGALHASIRNGYETEPASHRLWVRTQQLPDYRLQDRPILGSAPDLEKVNEGGEYRSGSMTDEKTSYKVDKYGKIVTLTEEVLRNDNLGAFVRVAPAMGQAARRKEADIVYALFALNSAAGPAMSDGINLFHSSHANLASNAALSATSLGAGRSLLRKQTALGGGYLSLVPRFLIVPAEQETAAEVILSNATRRMTTEKTTPEWIASLELVVEPRLANTAAYLAADSGQLDTFELGLLEENLQGPSVQEQGAFERDEYSWKVKHVFGAAALDWRGLVRMPF